MCEEVKKPFALSLFFDKLRMIGMRGFDRLGPNGRGGSVDQEGMA
jgi:hypothetical protein